MLISGLVYNKKCSVPEDKGSCQIAQLILIIMVIFFYLTGVLIPVSPSVTRTYNLCNECSYNII